MKHSTEKPRIIGETCGIVGQEWRRCSPGFVGSPDYLTIQSNEGCRLILGNLEKYEKFTVGGNVVSSGVRFVPINENELETFND